MRHSRARRNSPVLLAILFLSLLVIFFTSCASSEARAARRGDLDAVKEFINDGGDVNERQRGGMTLLMHASAGGQVSTIDYLVGVGADVHMKDDNGLTALIHGASSGQNGSVNSLLSHGSEVNAVTNAGQTSLLIAASNDYSALVQTLLAAGGDFRKMDNAGWTALLKGLQKSASDPSGINQSSWLLFQAGADFRVDEKPVDTIAFTSAGSGNRDVLQLLLDRGLNPGIADSRGNTLLHAGAGQPEMLSYLLDLGLNPNMQNSQGETPLINAVRKGSQKSIETLLFRGANTEIPDSDRKNPAPAWSTEQ